MKVSYQTVEFFNKLLKYVECCDLIFIEDRSENDYISFFIKIRYIDGNEQDISITVENNKDSNIEVLFHKSDNDRDRLLVINQFSMSFSTLHDIISVCSERIMLSWMKENHILKML